MVNNAECHYNAQLLSSWLIFENLLYLFERLSWGGERRGKGEGEREHATEIFHLLI